MSQTPRWKLPLGRSETSGPAHPRQPEPTVPPPGGDAPPSADAGDDDGPPRRLSRTGIGVVAGVLGVLLGGTLANLDDSAAAEERDAATEKLSVTEKQLVTTEDELATIQERLDDAREELVTEEAAGAAAVKKAVATERDRQRRERRTAVKKAVEKERAKQRVAREEAVAAARAEERARIPAAQPFVGGDGSSGGGTDRRFDTCTEANAAGYGNYRAGEDPEYDWYDDRDNDGVVCE